MKKGLSTIFATIIVLSLAATGFAGTFDEKCAMCHKPGNKPAKSKESLLARLNSSSTV